ncbi:YraN family protein [Tropicimonas sp. S265A]|uniref:YraN family protein n=1 Tax=Tropicimonas sp. S265A TaxID=3415134 RepID=UPI003C7D579D
MPDTAVPCAPLTPEAARRSARGKRAYLSGASAEQAVARAYLRRGCTMLGERVRIGPGEIDLVFRRGDLLVFVEVKARISHDRALESLTQAQLARLAASAQCFQGAHPELELLDMRIDLALVDGTGRIQVVPNITL